MKLTGSSFDCTGFLQSKHLFYTGNCGLFNKGEIKHQEEDVNCFMSNFGNASSYIIVINCLQQNLTPRFSGNLAALYCIVANCQYIYVSKSWWGNTGVIGEAHAK